MYVRRNGVVMSCLSVSSIRAYIRAPEVCAGFKPRLSFYNKGIYDCAMNAIHDPCIAERPRAGAGLSAFMNFVRAKNQQDNIAKSLGVNSRSG